MNNKQVNKIKLLISIFIILFSFKNFTPTMAIEGNDVLHLIKINSFHIEKHLGGTNWEILEDDVVLKIDDLVKFKVNWSVPNMTNISNGDYFEVELPSNYFYFGGGGAPLSIDLTNEQNQVIGKYDLIIGSSTKARITFNEFGASQDYLSNGYLEVQGLANKVTNDSIISIGDFSIIFDIEQKYIGDKSRFSEEWKQKIYKHGSQVLNNNTIKWDFIINADNYIKILENQEPSDFKNIVITDTLESGLVFPNDFEIAFTIPIMAMIRDNNNQVVTSNYIIDWMIPDYTTTYEIVQQDINDTLETFKLKVSNSAENKPFAYGIYRDQSTNIETFIFACQELSNQYMHISGGYSAVEESINRALANNSITLQEANDTKVSYQNLFNKTNGSGVTCIITSFITDVIDLTKPSFSNTIQIEWNNSTMDSTVNGIEFVAIDAGANTGKHQSVMITKWEKDTNNKLEGVGFKLQIKNEFGVYIDTDKEGKTDIDGQLFFNNLNPGDYKVVETSPLEGYSDVVIFANDIDTFSIIEGDIVVNYITVYNVKESKIPDPDNEAEEVDEIEETEEVEEEKIESTIEDFKPQTNDLNNSFNLFILLIISLSTIILILNKITKEIKFNN